ncbi:hypothetical protein QAD02_017401 [Eretmocerus hayati]|uniref:Uncharacterized protein n=1 Tax=Eretmocerus hayati TaxID=131215 RepID=A0ACC2PDE5_9HYME|nr:hypothetical protein QAD02_017401 [Eretmocerus hayati]
MVNLNDLNERERHRAPPPLNTLDTKEEILAAAISECEQSDIQQESALTAQQQQDRKKGPDWIQPRQAAGAKTLIEENKQRFPLDFDRVVEFLQACYHKSNVPEIAASYVTDMDALVDMLTEIEGLAGKNLKHRIKEIRKQIHTRDQDDNGSVVSDSSQRCSDFE